MKGCRACSGVSKWGRQKIDNSLFLFCYIVRRVVLTTLSNGKPEFTVKTGHPHKKKCPPHKKMVDMVLVVMKFAVTDFDWLWFWFEIIKEKRNIFFSWVVVITISSTPGFFFKSNNFTHQENNVTKLESLAL